MTKCYFEVRKSVRGSLATDIMRHLHTRQHLGKAIIVCDHPRPLLSAARKQWLKLSRNVQRQRAGTLNADQILKYTHTVTHMQHMRFTSKSPLEEPEADVYFLSEEMLEVLPARCFSVYVCVPLPRVAVERLLMQVPIGSLVIDYDQSVDWAKHGFEPKHQLEERVAIEWQQFERFLETYRIDIKLLSGEQLRSIDAMEEALDILLGASQKFLQTANDFQHALELARPLRLAKSVRQQYDAGILLAHRVQALTPGAFNKSFLETYREDDTFFLYDTMRTRVVQSTEPLEQAINRHLKAGRRNLAEALRRRHGLAVNSE